MGNFTEYAIDYAHGHNLYYPTQFTDNDWNMECMAWWQANFNYTEYTFTTAEELLMNNKDVFYYQSSQFFMQNPVFYNTANIRMDKLWQRAQDLNFNTTDLYNPGILVEQGILTLPDLNGLEPVLPGTPYPINQQQVNNNLNTNSTTNNENTTNNLIVNTTIFETENT